MTDVAPFKPMTKEDVAQVMGVSIRYVELLVEAGRMPRWKKVGKHSLYHPDVFWGWYRTFLTSADDGMPELGDETPSFKSDAKRGKPKTAVAGARRTGVSKRLALIDQMAEELAA